MSKDKKGILEMSKKGHLIQKAEDLNKDPYIFEFLGLPEDNLFTESELENRLLIKLQEFLLELGKGFAFIFQQHRITLNNKHFRVDLVFYHYILKCFVLIDLKVDKLKHHDITHSSTKSHTRGKLQVIPNRWQHANFFWIKYGYITDIPQ